MKSFLSRSVVWGFALLFGRGAFAVCPSINLDVSAIPGACLGETIEVAPMLDEIPGNCNGMTTYPYKRWQWSVGGVSIAASNNSLPARFTTLSSGEGTIRFDLICRSRECPDCNQNFSAERKFDVVHVGIAQSNYMVCWKETAAYLSVTPDTHAPNGVRWTSRPHGIYGEGDSVEFDPSRMMPQKYVVVAKNDGPPNCPAASELHVVKADVTESELYLSAEDSEATLSLTGDSYSPGGYVWSSVPDGISSNGPGKSIVFVPSNLPPGKYVVRCASADLSDCYDECEVYILKVELVPDWNHDRKIDDQDRDQATAANPFRFWINDDKDVDDVASGDSDVPGKSDGNASDDTVNGRCDLLDFFPVWVDLEKVVDLFPSGYHCAYVLRQADGAVNFFQSDLVRGDAGNYLIEESQSYGWGLDARAHLVPVVNVPAGGVDVATGGIDLLGAIHANSDKGVLILEAKAPSTSPLILEIHKNGPTGPLLYETQLPLSLSGVEEMYRWINLRPGRAADSRPGPPTNFPDADSNGKQIVFVHGYNNTEDEGRATASEVFKRLYWSGSRAMFTGVTWFGDEQGGLLDPSAYYHLDVINAFDAASNLVKSVGTLPGKKYIMAHSLGNMLVSSAIKDHGLSATNYFMLDAAVAIEAYSSAQLSIDEMRPTEWMPYSNRIWAADWHALFPTNDGRCKLTWRNRFSDISNAVNYYSSGEDILQNNSENPPDPESIWNLLNLWKTGQHVWCFQEMIKGGPIPAILWGVDSHGGWGFNFLYQQDGQLPDPNYVNGLSDETLRGDSAFKIFYDLNLHYSAIGSILATDPAVRAKLLAEAIPALSFATGRNPVPFTFNDNKDMMEFKTAGMTWPRPKGNWWHSDFKGVAYSFNYGLYDDIRDRGDMK